MAGRSRTGARAPSLNPRQLAALKAAAPSGNDILANIDGLNEEIVEQAEAKGVELEVGPAPDLRNITPISEESVQNIRNMKTLVDTEEIYPQEPAVDELAAEQKRLDALLEEQRKQKATEAAAAPNEADPVKEELSIEQQVLQMLKKQPDAPSDAQIAAWKNKYGESGVQVMALGDSDVYVFTYLRRAQLQSIQLATTKQSQIEGMAKDPDEYMAEQVLKQCVLWPKLQVNFWYNSRAGVIPTLYQSIMLHSYHLTPQQAMVLTAQL